jgi:hypothetical protein
MSPIEVTVDEPKSGWAIIRDPLSEFRKNVELERLPGLLDRTLTTWLVARPEVRVRATLPIVEEGFTTALHVWWD